MTSEFMYLPGNEVVPDGHDARREALAFAVFLADKRLGAGIPSTSTTTSDILAEAEAFRGFLCGGDPLGSADA